MTEKEAKKHIAASMPAILTGTAALIAALTTTYISVRGDASPVSAKPQIAASAPTVANPPDAGVIGTTPPVVAQPVVAAAVQSMRLKVERIAVHSDGTAGTTDWRFIVEVDGEPRFTFEQARLTDEGGLNIAVPEDAMTTLQLAAGTPAKITVKGWRRSAMRAAPPLPDAQGEGRIGTDGKPEPIQVSGAEQNRGAFTFYFSARPAEG